MGQYLCSAAPSPQLGKPPEATVPLQAHGCLAVAEAGPQCRCIKSLRGSASGRHCSTRSSRLCQDLTAGGGGGADDSATIAEARVALGRRSRKARRRHHTRTCRREARGRSSPNRGSTKQRDQATSARVFRQRTIPTAQCSALRPPSLLLGAPFGSRGRRGWEGCNSSRRLVPDSARVNCVAGPGAWTPPLS